MKKIFLIVCLALFGMVMLTMNSGCKNEPTAPASTATPLVVMFSVANNGLSNHCGGSPQAWIVSSITLKHSVTGDEATVGCSVSSGYTKTVNFTITANDTYDVFINTENYCCNPGSGCAQDSAIFNDTPLTGGSTYTAALSGGTTSTLDGVHSTGIF